MVFFIVFLGNFNVRSRLRVIGLGYFIFIIFFEGKVEKI